MQVMARSGCFMASVRLEGTEIVVLLGTNGNGKSTLMKCVMGMVKSDSGEMYFETDGRRTDLRDKSTEEVVSLGISLIPEGRRLFPGLTVPENLLIGAYRLGARRKLKENLKLNYDLFPRIAERKNQVAGSLSGGESRMLAVARSIMSNPKVLLVDEPLVDLAPLFVNHVLTKIKELKEKYHLSSSSSSRTSRRRPRLRTGDTYWWRGRSFSRARIRGS